MTMRHAKLIRKAIEKHGKCISKPGSCKRLDDCFTEAKPGVMAFWYNRETGSTTCVLEDH